MKNLFVVFLFAFGLHACQQHSPAEKELPTKKLGEGETLVHEMVESIGGLDAYKKLEDVTFTYTYRDTVKGVQDISLERFVYDGELSWGEYTTHTKNVFPDKQGPVSQAWNGKKAWVIVEGSFVPAPPAIRVAKFSRNTAFFWFNMMFKLLDPGANHERLEDRYHDDKLYNVVKVTYGKNVGDAQDQFILYINPVTKLVDQFLFTNMFFGAAEPRLMQVEYTEVHGIKWPAYRRYKPADWEGNILPNTNWAEQISENIQFNTGIDKFIFDKPILTKVPMADIRNNIVKQGITEQSTAKGKELLGKYEEASGGFDKWSSYKTGTFTQTADWYGKGKHWTIDPQQYSLTAELGTMDGELTLIDGPMAGKTWTTKAGKVHAIEENGDKVPDYHEIMTHSFPYKTYWFQFPFKVREADFISYAGTREIEGQNYEALFVTWHSEEPNTEFDQYILYLNPDTYLLDYLEFTLRDFNQFATGIVKNWNFQESGCITLPMSMSVTTGLLAKPMQKLHENHYHEIKFN